MSLAYSDLTPVKVVDPRVNLHEAEKYLFRQPANVVTHKTITANSASDTRD